MQRLSNSTPVFFDTQGVPLTGGYIYVGAPNTDPITNPLNLFWDKDLSIPAVQPLRTIGGLIVNGTIPAAVFLAETDFSQTVLDENDVQVEYSPSVFSVTSGFQPINSGLTAISALATTSYGRALLTLANQAALQAAVGYTPFTGGTVTTNIVRQGAGTHLYHNDSALTSGRVFVTAKGAADPTSMPGDIWYEVEP